MERALILSRIFAFFIILSLSYVFLRHLPGGPFDEDQLIDPLVKQILLSHQQDFSYLNFMMSFFKGDLGSSQVYPERSVVGILVQGVGVSLHLGLLTMIWVGVGALVFAQVLARVEPSRTRSGISWCIDLVLTWPNLFWGPVLILIFSSTLGLLPSAQLTDWRSYVLPSLVLGLRPWAHLTRVVSESLQEITQKRFFLYARAKGLSSRQAIWHHGVPVVWPIGIQAFGLVVIQILSGSFWVEILFAIPGVGTRFWQALMERDLPVILGFTIYFSGLVVVVQSLVDLWRRRPK